MLNPECLAFQEDFTAGEHPPHRTDCGICADCAAFAAVVERLAGARFDRPLPSALAERLAAIPATSAYAPDLPLPLPQRALPAALESRLAGIARQAPARRSLRKPPFWVLEPRWAVAASYLLVVLWGVAFGNPGDLARRGQARAEGLVSAVSRGLEKAQEAITTSADGALKEIHEEAGKPFRS